MHRDGTDPDNVQFDDVLCNFCGEAAWARGIPCVEGHRGSVICGACLREAYTSLVLGDGGVSHPTCTMCLEQREESMWLGNRETAAICRRCARQSAGVLHKSKDWKWRKPTPDP
ncbi:MAG: hypothetical protein QGG74_06055 [Phycisphaerales bacterium]|jgi:hypothetical protein|nr:hypothetical protein [Phycisphaerales bacterium]